MVLAKLMPIANVNRIVLVNYESVSQFGTNHQQIAVWRPFAVILWCRVTSQPNRIALGDWQAVNLFDLANFLHPKLCTIRQPILPGVFSVVIGLQNKTALSVILCESVISWPNRNLQNLFELLKYICQTAKGWRIVQISWRIVNLQKQSYSHLQ